MLISLKPLAHVVLDAMHYRIPRRMSVTLIKDLIPTRYFRVTSPQSSMPCKLIEEHGMLAPAQMTTP